MGRGAKAKASPGGGEGISDQPDPPPLTVIKLVSPKPGPMHERGARIPDPPKPEPEPERPEKIGLFAADMTLRDLLTDVIRGDYSKLDWSVSEALRLVDPGERSPPLVRLRSANAHAKDRAICCRLLAMPSVFPAAF